MGHAVAEDQVRGAAADAVAGDALLRRRSNARIGGKSEIIVGTEGDVVATVHRNACTLRRLKQTAHAAQAAHFAICQFGSQLGVQ